MHSSSAATFESATCDFCGSDRVHEVFRGPDRLLSLPGTFSVVACEACGLLRQEPRPTAESIDFFYPSQYDPYSQAIDDDPSVLTRWSRRYGMRKRRRAIERIVSQGRLLDVGCATGNFLNEMRRVGHWVVEGVEPSQVAAAYASTRFGLHVHQSALNTADLAPASYDVITMWNVLEHLHSPMTNLREVAALLKPGGLFVFSIPNLSSLEARLFGRYWMGWELPRHLYFPSLRLMSDMLDAVGLDLLHWDCLVGAYQSYLLSLGFAMTAFGGDSWWVRVLLSSLGSMPMQLTSFPFFRMITAANRASLITGFARRNAA